ncbi:hypothetical protein GQ53DRAFT_805581 [Thozetella sp. PMI_491]|nr:hypothetical protein GQ53DRAFT_805581 [Thozetella sp. PMI_491]
MDVTSLLNTSSAAAAAAAAANRNSHQRSESLDQTPTPSATGGTTATNTAVPTPSPERTPPRRTSSSQSPNRNRTPWDAGGYSLPLTLDTKLIQTPSTARPAFYSESPTDGLASASPKSPKHKFSDSRSSLSSYTSSSNNSQSHSRISSLSTVSEFQPLGTLMTENSLDPRLPTTETFDMSVLSKAAPIIGVVQPPSPVTARPHHDEPTSPSSGKVSPKTVERRPGSPSDAAMMGRGLERIGEGDSDFGPLLRPESPPTRSHKRAVSAPDFAPLPTIGQHSIGSIPESSNPSGLTGQSSDAPILDGTIKCMYIENCDTNSQPRKAISHIFGRNKLCTRLIPNYVWVHFCRKHYQRSRYRNAQEYAKLQCELVLKQIARVQAWSDENKNQGKAGVVQDWSLTVRKREQKRLDDKTKKRRFQDDDLEDMDNFNDHAVALGTAVPQWLLEKTATGYSTAEIEAVVQQLKVEMDENRIAQIPDIEILPNITTDTSEESKAKAYPKRKPSTGNTHKRSHSMGVALRAAHEPFPMTRRVSQPNTGYWATPDFVSPVEKRPRIDGEYEDFYARGVTDRVIPTIGRRMGPLAHRPAFSNIRENQTEDRFYDERQPGAPPAAYNFGMASGPHGPLPAPTPQRVGGPHMTEHLELNQAAVAYHDGRTSRPSHQRSYSDVSAFNQTQQMTYRPSSSQGYPLNNTNFAAPYPYDTAAPMQYTAEYQNPYVAAATQGPPGYYDEMPARQPHYPPPQFYQQAAAPQPAPMGNAPRHMRHQSTPNAMRPMQMTRTLSGQGMNNSPMQTQYEAPAPSYHHVRHQSYAAPRSSMPRVDEDRDVYPARH